VSNDADARKYAHSVNVVVVFRELDMYVSALCERPLTRLY